MKDPENTTYLPPVHLRWSVNLTLCQIPSIGVSKLYNMNDQIDTLEKTKTGLTQGGESEMGQAKLANLDDNVLLAQGHAPVLKRTFDLLGSLGLGFRYEHAV